MMEIATTILAVIALALSVSVGAYELFAWIRRRRRKVQG
jgi:hypothetical protein